MNTFSERLLWLIETRAGGNQAAFARKAGLTPGGVGNYVNGQREPTADALFKLAGAGGVTAQWLKDGTGEKKDWGAVLKEEAAYAQEHKDNIDPGQVLFDLRIERRRNENLEKENSDLKEQLEKLKKVILDARGLFESVVPVEPPPDKRKKKTAAEPESATPEVP